MKESTEKSHSPFTTLGVIIVVSIICLVWNWTRPSYQRTIDFAVQHQSLLEEYVALARSHSPEAESVWEQIKQCRYFTSVSCTFSSDQNGTIQVHFSVPDGGIINHPEGHYQVCYCLLWQDTDYQYHHGHYDYLYSYWQLLGEEDGIAITQGGNWYWTSHKHWMAW